MRTQDALSFFNAKKGEGGVDGMGLYDKAYNELEYFGQRAAPGGLAVDDVSTISLDTDHTHKSILQLPNE